MFRATPDSPRMFDSDLLDGFSRVPWWVVPAIFVPAIAGICAVALRAGVTPRLLVGQLAVGWFAWTLLEYWLHRTLFHWVPDTPWGERFHFLLHGVHHKWFRDRYRLVMPPPASFALAIPVYAAILVVSQLAAPWLSPTWRFGVFAGLILGYLVYDLMHYTLHHAKPGTRIGRALRAHHNKHHHNPAYANLKFGVSTTLWDHVFGTYEVRQ